MKKLRVVVIDMQPITPAVGGGRQRLLGLYHGLGDEIDCTYVGSYDWPGESLRDHRVTKGLREIVVPLSPAHHAAAQEYGQKLGGVTVIDAVFPEQAALSPEFAATAAEHIETADVVVFTHPWCYPALAGKLRRDQLVVHDSQNVETLLKTEALAGLPHADRVLRLVAESEMAVLYRSDLILACSREDATMFTRVFDLPSSKIRVVPNGAFTERFDAAETVDRAGRRPELGLPANAKVAIFLGSMYGPNIEAARFIVRTLAPKCPDVTFMIAGGVGEALADESARANVIVTGPLDEAQRDACLLVADVALNPMDAGSGTNVKMFDYMSAGLPVLSTEIGARGVATSSRSPRGVVLDSLEGFHVSLPRLLSDVREDPSLRTSVRDTARANFSWERISAELGLVLRNAYDARHRNKSTVALLSTWNISCGIAEHSGYLAEAFAESGYNVVVYGNEADGHAPLGFEREIHFSVAPVWRWDNIHWRESGLNGELLARQLQLDRPSLLLIQQHTGFLPDFDIGVAVEKARQLNIPVVIEMHDGRKVAVATKQSWVQSGAALVAHHQEELENVEGDNAHVLPLPIRKSSIRKFSNAKSAPVVAGFGFLRPYKGVITTIRVIAKMQARFPGIRYRGMHALYPGSESELHLAECLEEAERLGISGLVELNTGFQPVDQLVSELSSADVIVMPYEPSQEGASAAANLALSAGRPVLVSPSAIFRPVASVVAVASGYKEKDYVDALSALLLDPERADELSILASEWVERHSYASMVGAMMRFAKT